MHKMCVYVLYVCACVYIITHEHTHICVFPVFWKQQYTPAYHIPFPSDNC